MTTRLYYIDPYRRECDATIACVERRNDRIAVTLDRTTFYPTSGGQPFDTGALGAWRVVDVVDEADGSIVHIIDGTAEDTRSAFQIGQPVHAAIDWTRRFDHMQQHTGQHVLSAAFDRLFGVKTVSFHLGAAVSTVDLERETTARDIAAAEDEANQIVWEDRPVSIRFATAEDAASLPLRKESPREGQLRLIDIDGFDLSACGGTHVSRTGAIGIIAIGSWERFKGGQRLEFQCGGRALARIRSLRDTVASSVKLLSVGADELPASIERLQTEVNDRKRAMTTVQGELARYRAEELAASAEQTGKGRLVIRTVDADASELKMLAAAITSKPGHAVALISATSPALVAIARSADVPISACQILATLTTKFGGRGGGKSDLAQGGGLDAPAAAILDAARAAILV